MNLDLVETPISLPFAHHRHVQPQEQAFAKIRDRQAQSHSAERQLTHALLGDDFQLLHAIGEGAYGTVAAALHKPTGRQVAIKKVLPFDHTLFAIRTLRELKLLRFFSEDCVNENVRTRNPLQRPADDDRLSPSLTSSNQRPKRPLQRSTVSAHDLCTKRPRTSFLVIQELMQTDLHRVIRTQNLTDDHCQVLTTHSPALES